MNKPLISVLMTAFNREQYIGEAIISVLNSSYQNFELIIVDDCSTDNTYKIASSYLLINAKIKLYQNKRNLGQFANRNKAIELSQGQYCKFLDSDDKLMPNGLEVMVKSMLAYPDAGLGVPVKNQFVNDLPYKLTPHDSLVLHYKGENHLCYGPTGTIFKKDALLKVGLFENKYGILADTLLNIKIASIFPTVLFEKELFFWRRHDDQITEEQNDDVRMIRERNVIMKVLMEYKFLPLSKNETNYILNNFVKINTKHCLQYFLKGRFKDALQIKTDTGISLKAVLVAFIK